MATMQARDAQSLVPGHSDTSLCGVSCLPLPLSVVDVSRSRASGDVAAVNRKLDAISDRGVTTLQSHTPNRLHPAHFWESRWMSSLVFVRHYLGSVTDIAPVVVGVFTSSSHRCQCLVSNNVFLSTAATNTRARADDRLHTYANIMTMTGQCGDCYVNGRQVEMTFMSGKPNIVIPCPTWCQGRGQTKEIIRTDYWADKIIS